MVTLFQRVLLSPFHHVYVRGIAIFMALLVFVMGAVNILSAWVGIEHSRLAILKQILPLEVHQGSRTLTAVAGVLLIWLSWSLLRRKRRAWTAAIIILALSSILHILKGLDVEEALAALLVLVGLLIVSDDFVVRSDAGSYKNALLFSVIVLIGSLLYGVLGYALLRHHFMPAYSFFSALQATFALLTQYAAPVLHPLPGHRDAIWFTDSLITIGVTSVLLIMAILLRPVVFALHVFEQERDEVKRLLQVTGGPPLAYWALWTGFSYYFAHDRRAVVAYRVVAGVALVLGDPLGYPDAVPQLIDSFAQYCHLNDWRPAWYQITDRWISLMHNKGWVGLKIGEDACISLANLQFTGKSWQDVRTSLNRFSREKYTSVWYDINEDKLGWRVILSAISEQWLGKKHGDEKGFSLGTWDTAQRYADEQRLLVLVNPSGQPEAFLTFVPIYGENGGWALDLMRRSTEAPPGAIEYLIAVALQQFQQEGAHIVSLGLSPLASVTTDDAVDTPEILESLRALVQKYFSNLYNLAGLQHFKAKFRPNWEARYLVCLSMREMPRVVYALIRAHHIHQPELPGDKVLKSLSE